MVVNPPNTLHSSPLTGVSRVGQSRRANQQQAETRAVQAPDIQSLKAFFAVDENGNVVIRVIDAQGELVRQIPPEELAKMSTILKEQMEHLLDIEA